LQRVNLNRRDNASWKSPKVSGNGILLDHLLLTEIAASRVILRDRSLSVVGASLGLAPSLALFFALLIIFAGISAFEGLHGVGNSGVFLSILAFLNILILDFSDGFLGLWVSVHEEINNDIPRLVAGDIASELEDLTSEEPEAVSDGVLALVVRWDSDVDVVEG
jgi:hypothetical protein